MLIRVFSGASDIAEYLEQGRKRGREFERDLIDRRVPLSGDLVQVRVLLASIPESTHGYARYLHITLGFAERFSAVEANQPGVLSMDVLRRVDAEFRQHLMAAYDPAEYQYYSEAHIPKLSHELGADGVLVERLPHIHVVIPMRNLADGRYLNPLGFGKVNLRYLDAIQEDLNERHGLKSPKDSRRTVRPDPLVRHTGIRQPVLETVSRAIERGEIGSFEELARWSATRGEVRVRHGCEGDYVYIKPTGAAKGINLKQYPNTYFEGRRQSRAKESQALVEYWTNWAALEARYISSKKRKAYCELGEPDRRALLDGLQSQSRQKLQEMDQIAAKFALDAREWMLDRSRHWDEKFAQEVGGANTRPSIPASLTRPREEDPDELSSRTERIRNAAAHSLGDGRDYDRSGSEFDGPRGGSRRDRRSARVRLRAAAQDRDQTRGDPRPTERTGRGHDDVEAEGAARADSRRCGRDQVAAGALDDRTRLSGSRRALAAAEGHLARLPRPRPEAHRAPGILRRLFAHRLVATLARRLQDHSPRHAQALSSLEVFLDKPIHHPTPEQLKRETRADLVLQHAARRYSIKPEAYRVIYGADGSPWILHGGKRYDLGDFLTKHLKVPRAEARPILEDCWRASRADQPAPAPTTLWSAFALEDRLHRLSMASERRRIREDWKAERLAIHRIYHSMIEESGRTHEGRALAQAERLRSEDRARAHARNRLKDFSPKPRAEAYREYLQKVAQSGNLEALTLLRGMVIPGNRIESNLISGRNQDQAALPLPHYRVEASGSVTYLENGRPIAVDGIRGVQCLAASDGAYQAALQIAVARYGRNLELTGDRQFVDAIQRAARRASINVTFQQWGRERSLPR